MTIWNSSKVAEVADQLMTSADWHEYTKKTFIILDPDGWDRKNYEYSFYEEKITKEEFEKRAGLSTVSLTGGRVSLASQLGLK